ncbi:hypothetical protein BDZ89DRAFT_1079044, partial [Hymenopellis radicata]
MNSVLPPPPILNGELSAPVYIPIDRNTVPIPPACYPDDVPRAKDWFPPRAWALTDFITRHAVQYYAEEGRRERIIEQYKAGRRVPMDVRESGVLKHLNLPYRRDNSKRSGHVFLDFLLGNT